MNGNTLDFQIRAGLSFVRGVDYKQADGSPVDLAGAEIVMNIFNAESAFNFPVTLDRDDPNGHFSWNIEPGDTEDFPANTRYEIKFTDTGGVTSILLEGEITTGKVVQ